MKRRRFLRSCGIAVAAGGTGCLGLGGEAVVSVQQRVSVEPGDGWVEEIPDVSDPGGAISYIVRSNDGPFDVYLFVGREQYQHYNDYVKGNEPEETPKGHESFSKSAVPKEGADGELYEVSTTDDGAREPLDRNGPYYFVVDHSSYRMENRVEEFDEPLGAFVDLTVVRNKLPV